MLSSMDLLKMKAQARDGEIGQVKDLRFNDVDWTVRDVEIGAGPWPFGKNVIVEPEDIVEPETPMLALQIDASRDDAGKLREADAPAVMPAAPEQGRLHRLSEVAGFSVRAGDERLGTLDGFLIDTVAWDLPLALVRLSRDGTVVLLPSRLVRGILWPERSLQAAVEPDQLRNAPSYDPRIQDERVFLPVVTDYYAALCPAA